MFSHGLQQVYEGVNALHRKNGAEEGTKKKLVELVLYFTVKCFLGGAVYFLKY